LQEQTYMRLKLIGLFICLLPTSLFADITPQQGKATFYASSFKGHKTTSGERYDPAQLTAAHATLPLQSVVQVQHLQSGRSVVVRINDRMSRNSRYLIDVSRKAAQALGIVNAGSGMVKITLVTDPVELAALKKKQTNPA
jgi:rare lipoprotein A